MPGLNVGPRKARQAPPGGLFSVADIVDTEDRIVGGVDADPILCATVNVGEGWCFPEEGEPETKVVEGFSDFSEEDGNGDGFFTYLGVECYLNGGSLIGEAQEAFGLGEQVAVESYVSDMLVALSTADSTTPGSLVAALARAQEVARTIPGAIIHMSSQAAILLGGHIRFNDDFSLHTRLGTPISAGLPEGESVLTMYVSGPVTLYRGVSATKEVANYRYNKDLVLVERPWSALIDCGAVSITATGIDGGGGEP